jgi:hypothetical protein
VNRELFADQSRVRRTTKIKWRRQAPLLKSVSNASTETASISVGSVELARHCEKRAMNDRRRSGVVQLMLRNLPLGRFSVHARTTGPCVPLASDGMSTPSSVMCGVVRSTWTDESAAWNASDLRNDRSEYR